MFPFHPKEDSLLEPAAEFRGAPLFPYGPQAVEVI